MSSMYKGVLIVVAATVISSAMILMTGNSNADNKELESSNQQSLSGNKVMNNIGTKSVAIIAEGKNPSISPPPGPFVYGAPDSVVSNSNEKNKSPSANTLYVKKPQAPILSSALEINKLNAPVKPATPAPQVVLKQAPVVSPSEPKMPVMQQEKVAPQYHNDDLLKSRKPIGSLSVFAPPSIPNIKLSAPKLERVPVPNIIKPQAPTFQVKKPTKPVNNVPILKAPNFVSNTENLMPQNIIPSYPVSNSTMPTFYYYYPVPNWNNSMQNNWNANQQLWSYDDYRLAPQINRHENLNIRNKQQGQFLQDQNISPPLIMQRNNNKPSVNE